LSELPPEKLPRKALHYRDPVKREAT